MTEAVDKIGVVRDHRWLKADVQASRLRERCPKVVSLGGGKLLPISREDLERLVRPGTVLEFVHAFLLAEPKRKRTAGGMRADFRAALARLEKRGAVVVDVDGQVCSGKQRKALLALADSDIGRSNQGAKSATNGARSKGRPEADFTQAQWDQAETIWGNTKKYPSWEDAEAALRKIVDSNGQQFTAARAYSEWRGRV